MKLIDKTCSGVSVAWGDIGLLLPPPITDHIVVVEDVFDVFVVVTVVDVVEVVVVFFTSSVVVVVVAVSDSPDPDSSPDDSSPDPEPSSPEPDPSSSCEHTEEKQMRNKITHALAFMINKTEWK